MRGKEEYMKLRNKLVKVLFVAALAAGTVTMTAQTVLHPMNVQAADVETTDVGDMNVNNGTVNFGQGTASITIKGNEGQSLVGKRFEVFRLFNAENSQGGESINYTWNENYKLALQTVVAKALNQSGSTELQPADVTEYMVIDYIQSLNSNPVEGTQAPQELEGSYSAFRYFVEDVRDEIKAEKKNGDMIYVNATKADNSITLAGLQYGYYIIDEVSEHDENDDQWYASSLCMVDTANPNAEINIKSDYPEIIKKIQEDDGNVGWNDIADYEIGQTVPYKYESTIPNMNGYDTYYYAWHDKMDEALTFNDNKDHISIVIRDTDGNEYKLQNSEYNVITNPGDGETFKIEVQDIKKIVDKHFNEMNDKNENVYDQTVTLTYEATLNDKAADDTGRPGFENDVRLEFSNDADSEGTGDTGFTPWDTVVCFTFKIDGLKVNDHNVKLEGAKFRLYSDKDCKNEVYVKENPSGGYNVINRDAVGGDDHTGGTKPEDAVEMVSDKDGVFTIYGLDQGTYYLKETDAPDGYRPLLDPIVLTLTPTYTDSRNDYVKGDGATDKTLKELDATAHIKSFYDGAYTEDDVDLVTDVEDGSADIQIVNQVGMKLPVTGSSATLIILGAGVALMAGAAVASKKMKKTPEEK